VTIDEARERTANKLLRASLGHSYDPEIEIDWEAPPDPDKLYAPAHRVSLYGTPLWDRLDERQRIELSKHEVASIASIGIWFETILMRMLLRQYHKQDPTSGHAQYALTEIADECRHSVMFGRMIATFGTPVYRLGRRDEMLGRFLTATARGVRMFAAILIAEEILDACQREAMADETVQPLVRMVSRIHVIEEARHVRWAKDELERSAPLMGAAERAYSQLVIGRAAHTIARNLVNPQAYRAVGIEPAVGRRAAVANPHHRETLKWAGAKVTSFFGDLGLIGGAGMPFWRRSFLI
jgi:P-aminobenzoate N-oxygenase AurF